MKTLKLTTLLITGLAFIACSKTSNNTRGILPEKKVVQIFVKSNENGRETSYNYTIDYDEEGRIIKIEPDYPEMFGIFYCEYNKRKIRMGKGDSYISGSLNKKGNIKWAKSDYFLEEFTGKMTYNNRGQLKAIWNLLPVRIAFKWKDDNLVQIKAMGEHADIAYTSLENKNKFNFPYTVDIENCTPVFPYYMLLGKPSKNLPLSFASEGETYISYEYKTDNDGYINEMRMIYPDNSKTVSYTFVYE